MDSLDKHNFHQWTVAIPGCQVRERLRGEADRLKGRLRLHLDSGCTVDCTAVATTLWDTKTCDSTN